VESAYQDIENEFVAFFDCRQPYYFAIEGPEEDLPEARTFVQILDNRSD